MKTTCEPSTDILSPFKLIWQNVCANSWVFIHSADKDQHYLILESCFWLPGKCKSNIYSPLTFLVSTKSWGKYLSLSLLNAPLWSPSAKFVVCCWAGRIPLIFGTTESGDNSLYSLFSHHAWKWTMLQRHLLQSYWLQLSSVLTYSITCFIARLS